MKCFNDNCSTEASNGGGTERSESENLKKSLFQVILVLERYF